MSFRTITHAVTALSNGNMTQRYVGGQTYNLSYDGDNHLVGVSGAASAEFIYDGDGNRIISRQGGTETVYIGNYFEWTGSVNTMKRYYYAETTRVALREGNAAPTWLFGDHLGSTSLVANNDGTLHSELRYKAWGETRFSYGTVPTSFRFTGQREESSMGLYHFGARWYDPALSRWIQPDTIIPEATQGVQAWDRYAYTNNNSMRYIDPGGYTASCPMIDGQFCTTPKPTLNNQRESESNLVYWEIPVCEKLESLTGSITIEVSSNNQSSSHSYDSDPNGNPIVCYQMSCVPPLLANALTSIFAGWAPPNQYAFVASAQYTIEGGDVNFYLVTVDNTSPADIQIVSLEVESALSFDPIVVVTTNSIGIYGNIPAGQFGSSGVFNANANISSMLGVTLVVISNFSNGPGVFIIPLTH